MANHFHVAAQDTMPYPCQEDNCEENSYSGQGIAANAEQNANIADPMDSSQVLQYTQTMFDHSSDFDNIIPFIINFVESVGVDQEKVAISYYFDPTTVNVCFSDLGSNLNLTAIFNKNELFHVFFADFDTPTNSTVMTAERHPQNELYDYATQVVRAFTE